jgi:hypothetical protein
MIFPRPVIRDGDRGLGSFGVIRVADEPGDRDASAACRVERGKRLVAVAVDLGQVAKLRGGERRLGA